MERPASDVPRWPVIDLTLEGEEEVQPAFEVQPLRRAVRMRHQQLMPGEHPAYRALRRSLEQSRMLRKLEPLKLPLGDYDGPIWWARGVPFRTEEAANRWIAICKRVSP